MVKSQAMTHRPPVKLCCSILIFSIALAIMPSSVDSNTVGSLGALEPNPFFLSFHPFSRIGIPLIVTVVY
jgi:hypothetical protein